LRVNSTDTGASSGPAPALPATSDASDPPEQPQKPKKKRKTTATETAAPNDGDGENDDDDDLPSCLHPDDPANFLKLSRALQLLLAQTLKEEDISAAGALLSEYCSELVLVCSHISSDYNPLLTLNDSALWP
jgi:hypothetical protein